MVFVVIVDYAADCASQVREEEKDLEQRFAFRRCLNYWFWVFLLFQPEITSLCITVVKSFLFATNLGLPTRSLGSGRILPNHSNMMTFDQSDIRSSITRINFGKQTDDILKIQVTVC